MKSLESDELDSIVPAAFTDLFEPSRPRFELLILNKGSTFFGAPLFRLPFFASGIFAADFRDRSVITSFEFSKSAVPFLSMCRSMTDLILSLFCSDYCSRSLVLLRNSQVYLAGV